MDRAERTFILIKRYKYKKENDLWQAKIKRNHLIECTNY